MKLYTDKDKRVRSPSEDEDTSHEFLRMNHTEEEVEDEEAELVEDDVFPPHNGRYVGGYRI